MVAEPQPYLTREAYLQLERHSDTKHEYIAGELVAMVGGSARHSQIGANVVGTFYLQLRDRPCIVYNSDLRVAIQTLDVYTYPDATIVCGEPQFEDDSRETLLNPTVIIEVLSPSTESYDRPGKFLRYQRIPSFQDYVLIAQDTPLIEHFTRQTEKQWLWAAAEGLMDTITLPSIGCTLALSEVYAKVAFD